jgi:hypothetical protein
MNTSLKVFCCFAAASILAAAHAAPPTVNAEQMDLDVDISAKILKEKAKRNPGAQQAGNSGGGAAGSSSNCGSVNINSTDPKDKKSSGGIAEMMGNKSTTVVLGPVINMANCK